MIHHATRLARRILGVVLVLVGIVGLLMPILPGWLFLIPGAVLLGLDIPTMVRFLVHLEERYPAHGRFLGAIRRRLHRYHTGEDCEPPMPKT